MKRDILIRAIRGYLQELYGGDEVYVLPHNGSPNDAIEVIADILSMFTMAVKRNMHKKRGDRHDVAQAVLNVFGNGNDDDESSSSLRSNIYSHMENIIQSYITSNGRDLSQVASFRTDDVTSDREGQMVMAAALDYICAELLELSCEFAKKRRSRDVLLCDVMNVFFHDHEMAKFIPKIVSPGSEIHVDFKLRPPPITQEKAQHVIEREERKSSSSSIQTQHSHDRIRPSSATAATKPRAPKAKKQTPKPCKDGKIRNPLTNRCIKRDGAVHKKLQKQGLV